MIKLNGKKALVTGGSRGIGRATAILLAEAGADVAVHYQRNQIAAQEVKDLVEKIGQRCLPIKAEISDQQEVEHMVKEVIEQLGRIDILINNAGIWTYGEMGAMPQEIWRETMAVNLDGVYYVTNAVVPHMKKQGQGWIVNVASTAAVRGEAFHSHYAASKGALVSLTKSLAVELAPYNIRVNCVAPGWVDTDMCVEVFSDPEFKEKVRQSIPLKRIPPPEDIAGPILFLVSDLARHITGEILNVNGGSVLCGG
ncbi:MAG: 3-oxoacyl-ACP reductase FabG [Candidatus Aminicenantes bacterium]|jgi:Dehydrogenases with different specificities (related to short-chain alcohol dehydrogenases)|nr:3-oxoacyl-ACP reductase FabG [Candidatus Aminicenantes bacterium]